MHKLKLEFMPDATQQNFARLKEDPRLHDLPWLGALHWRCKLGIDGLLVMKSIVVYDRVKSRDIYDLMVLTRDHGYTLDDIFAAIEVYQPIRNKDLEHFKSVVTGVIPLDKTDEGFSSIHQSAWR